MESYSYSFLCNLCDCKFGKLEQIEEHIKRYKCQYCNFHSCDPKVVDDHSERNHVDVKCTFCDYSSKILVDLVNHVSRNHLEIRCEKCEYFCHNDGEMKKHIELRHSMVKCILCDNFSGDVDSIVEHIKAVHTGPKIVEAVTCNVCKLVLSNQVELTEHYKTHVLNCDYCDYVTTNHNHMRIHKSHHHDDAGIEKCPHCDFKTKGKIAYLDHRRSNHESSCRIYKCTHQGCSFTTSYSSIIVRHIPIHGRKHVRCKRDGCHFICLTKSGLSRHMNKSHPL